MVRDLNEKKPLIAYKPQKDLQVVLPCILQKFSFNFGFTRENNSGTKLRRLAFGHQGNFYYGS